MPTTWNAIYLGTFDSIDPYEGDNHAEHAWKLENKVFGSATDPLHQHIVRVDAINNGGNTNALDLNNNNSNDQINVVSDDPNVAGLHTYDASIQYNATITYANGDTATVTAVIMQDTDGRIYLAPEFQNNADTTAYQDGPIQSISLGSIFGGDRALGLNATRVDTKFVCFAAGTMITTENGDRVVEGLQKGDMVQTMDHGLQPIRWIKSRTLGKDILEQNENLRPIRISAGALGHGLPERDLIVSPQHRVLVRSKIAIRMFDSHEVLIAAKHLCSVPGIEIATDLDEVTYVHVMFDRHQVIFSEGTPTESLYPGSQTMNTFDQEDVAELYTIFPELKNFEANPWPAARPFVNGRRGRRFAERHAKNRTHLLDHFALSA